MNLSLSWLKDFVDIDLGFEDLARLLTMAGLEVDSIRVVGLPLPAAEKHEFKITGLGWEPEKIVVAQIDEVMPHPNADRLVLCRLQDGLQEHIVLTGAPNLFEYKGTGPLAQPIKVAYAREGAKIYDGHQPGLVLTTLKRAKIRGVESYSMVCSEKELGISDEHEGVIILDADAPTGIPLCDYMGDAVYEISILPNMIRNASVMGVAREVAALTRKPLRKPVCTMPTDGPGVKDLVKIEIKNPEMNPRFVLGLVRGVKIGPSPYRVQLRLRLAGMRPINALVDATNYVMLEVGEPLHAFDYDVLVQRVGGKIPTIITRSANPGEKLTTLDGLERRIDDFTTLVCDTAGALSIAGVMGGAESEVTDQTRNILLEGAAWNFINIRKTVSSQKLNSEAAYRFARGVHPELAPQGVRVCLDRMAQWAGGQIAAGLVDEYPLPYRQTTVTVSSGDVKRLLGIDLHVDEIADMLERLDFSCSIQGDAVRAATPPHRMDIGEGLVGLADIMEEIARIYGYDKIPATRLSDTLPPQRGNPVLEGEERLKDILTRCGLQEVLTYRLTSPEREARLTQTGSQPEILPYVTLANPITPERSVMRRSLLAAVIEIVERNVRLRNRLALFEIGPVYLPLADQVLPDETGRLVIALTGLRRQPAWDQPETVLMDFFDLKGILEMMADDLQLQNLTFERCDTPLLHPGKSAVLKAGETVLGILGELHPLVREHYDLGSSQILVAELDMQALITSAPVRFEAQAVPSFPPVLEDIAVVVDEPLPVGRVVDTIRMGGGKLLTQVTLFDVFRGDRLGAGRKSLAFGLTYQAPDRTLTDGEAAQVRGRIIRRLEQDLDAKLRS